MHADFQPCAYIDAVSETLASIAENPAMGITPEDMAQRIDCAARAGRQSDREQITAAENRYDHAMRALSKVVASTVSASAQREQLKWAAGGGVVAGCLLWAILPGPLARSLPESWHVPEKIATRVLREPSMWEGGARLLRVGSAQAWKAISDAAEMRHHNEKVLADCERAAEKTRKTVRYSVNVAPFNASQHAGASE